MVKALDCTSRYKTNASMFTTKNASLLNKNTRKKKRRVGVRIYNRNERHLYLLL